jgi:hypothetical protein
MEFVKKHKQKLFAMYALLGAAWLLIVYMLFPAQDTMTEILNNKPKLLALSTIPLGFLLLHMVLMYYVWFESSWSKKLSWKPIRIALKVFYWIFVIAVLVLIVKMWELFS